MRGKPCLFKIERTSLVSVVTLCWLVLSGSVVFFTVVIVTVIYLSEPVDLHRSAECTASSSLRLAASRLQTVVTLNWLRSSDSCTAFCWESNMLFACYSLSVACDIVCAYSLQVEGIALFDKLEATSGDLCLLAANHIITVSLHQCWFKNGTLASVNKLGYLIEQFERAELHIWTNLLNWFD